MKKNILLFGLIILMASACVSKSGSYAGSNIGQIKEYISLGEDQSLMRALNKTKIDAIRQGVIDIIGTPAEQANREKLNEILYNTEMPNRYIVNNNIKILQKDKNGNIYVIKAKVPVKMKEVYDLLKSYGINSDESSITQKNTRNPQNVDELVFGNNKTNTSSYAATQHLKDADTVLDEAKASAKGKENLAFLNSYIENMTYMVFNAEKSECDPFLLKAGVETANGYLLKQGYRAIDANEVEKLKKDSAKVYQETSDSGISIIQLIAQKLNADVYMEIDAVTEGGFEQDGFYGSAKITLKIFNPSTGELLGSVPYSSPKTFSRVSSYDAQSNALQSTVYKALPIAIDQAKVLLAKAYSNGIRYEITINDTPDSKSMSRFRTELKSAVSRVKTIYQSAGQTKYEVLFFGTIDDLEATIYEVADATAGFNNLELVLLRGKTLTFKSGF